MTDVLLVGGGGREHALAWKLAQSPGLGRMVAAPGNPGIAAHARCVPIKDTAIDQIVALAQQERPDLVEKQREARAIWWDKRPRELAEERTMDQGRVPQSPYVYDSDS